MLVQVKGEVGYKTSSSVEGIYKTKSIEYVKRHIADATGLRLSEVSYFYQIRELYVRHI